MSVAEEYPARTDGNRTTWYRPGFTGKTPPSMWGWTSDPLQAHPDYAKAASLCGVPDNATPEDRAAILEFAAELQAKTAKVKSELYGNGPLDVPDIELPGMWERADFTGGREVVRGANYDPNCQDCNYDTHRCRGCGEPYLHGNHPSCKDCEPAENPAATQEKGNVVTEMMVDGSPDVARYSEYSRYPLPPIPPQVEVTVDGYQRYKVPSPSTGKLTGFTRATTVSRTTSEEYNLEQWKIRTKVMAVLKAKAAADNRSDGVLMIAGGDVLAEAYDALLKAMDDGKSRPINQAIDKIDDLAGGADARELGGAVHDWLGELDSGRILLHQIPEQFQPYAVAYQECLARAGLIAMPEFIERLVLNNRGIETICGRIDRIYRCVTDGQLYLGDLKTSESLDFSLLEYAIQFAAYGYAPLMCAIDRLGWEPMPKLVGLPHPSDDKVFGEDGDPRDPMCFCVHVPRTQPERSQVIPFNLRFGADAYIQALEVRKTRNAAKKEVLGQTTPIPSKEALRYVEARQALQNIHDEEDARNVMEKYEDVLDDGLMEFGAQCFELL
ncbi:hypothetical protein [Mycobacteroides abscessus]|uniref:hypothetical protein n=1 Tax=Mycobacteroides abscessus TaxID=36809 RepID=UPI000928F282|nr:hypothetical protein [Mycobacteroides abscessus]SIB68314.1 Uncharacterised protein [Mycobacteroides abscessus subsp. abscessus]